jgi:hypothetical protein
MEMCDRLHPLCMLYDVSVFHHILFCKLHLNSSTLLSNFWSVVCKEMVFYAEFMVLMMCLITFYLLYLKNNISV